MASLPKRRIVVLTGAGISAESGLATFRGAGGLWEGQKVEDVATPEAFAANPSRVHRFYNARRTQLRAPEIQPNAAHHALARLERDWPGEVLLVTQNVDDLHDRAGSREIIHMHGELFRARCTECGATTEWLGDMEVSSVCTACGLAGHLRPDIVWFGEMPFGLDRIARSLQTCALFAAIGTSGQVYPAAGFVADVKARGTAHTVEINLEPSSIHLAFDERIYGRSSETVVAWVDGLLAGTV